MKITVEVDADILARAMEASGAPSEELTLRTALHSIAEAEWEEHEKPFLVTLPALENWNAAMRKEDAERHTPLRFAEV